MKKLKSIKELLAEGETDVSIARIYGVPPRVIRRIIRWERLDRRRKRMKPVNDPRLKS